MLKVVCKLGAYSIDTDWLYSRSCLHDRSEEKSSFDKTFRHVVYQRGHLVLETTLTLGWTFSLTYLIC